MTHCNCIKSLCLDRLSKTLKPGPIPTINLPQKSHEESKPSTSRRVIEKKELVPSKAYKNINDLKSKVSKLVLKGWSRKDDDNACTLDYYDGKHALPLYSVKIDSGLGFTVAAFGWFLPDNHRIYMEHKHSVTYVSVSSLITEIGNLNVCPGLPPSEELPATDPVDGVSEITRHTVPLCPEVYCDQDMPYQASIYFRSADCVVLQMSSKDSCDSCSKVLNLEVKRQKQSATKKVMSVKEKAPLAGSSKERLIATIKQQRIESKALKEKLSGLEKEIERNSITVNEALESDLLSILGNTDLKRTPHMDFFWQQQKKLLSSPKFGRRYHPHLIRFCLSVHAKSPAAYRELASSGVLVLPSERVLRDYRNFFKPKPGFNKENIQKLSSETMQLFDCQRYVVLSFDEMKVQSNLVFDKHTNELIGFVDLGDEDVNAAVFDTPTTLASHILAFMVRGVASDLKFILGYFSTQSLTSFQIMPLFWKAVSILEVCCNLWVCAAVSDGASSNRKFYELHAALVGEDYSVDVIHRTINLFAPSRYIYFFSDAPHLLKTSRNCLFNSGTGKHSRLMWNGCNMIWNHISSLYYADLDQDLHQLPNHINLTSFSKMKVNLAAQVLSNTMALALRRFYPGEEAKETARFCEMMNTFFDCLNVRSTTEHIRKRNNLLAPYSSPDDARFEWLKNTFLVYLQEWLNATQQRAGNFSKDDRARMFISQQTYHGLRMTVHSFVEVTKFLLSEGMEYVLSEKFCQDLLEEYFGHQRARGGYGDNPTVQSFGYNDLTIATQRSIAPVIRGNVAGRHTGESSKWFVVSEEPLPKRKRKSSKKE